MFSTLLNIMMNRVSPDDTPGAYGGGIDIHITELIIGFIFGIIVTLLVMVTIKSLRSEEENDNNDKSDE